MPHLVTTPFLGNLGPPISMYPWGSALLFPISLLGMSPPEFQQSPLIYNRIP